uniref:ATP phosphoribosyltransferase regulatory subunit n=1 Tax=Bacillus subtilis TaxID=1423 RepID=UPI0016428B52
SKLVKEGDGVRVGYGGNVFRGEEGEGGGGGELEEVGVELMGEGRRRGDGEVIALVVGGLKNGGVGWFKIGIGDGGIGDGLFVEVVGKVEGGDVLGRLLYEKK